LLACALDQISSVKAGEGLWREVGLGKFMEIRNTNCKRTRRS
jgi:hypothetical protein